MITKTYFKPVNKSYKDLLTEVIIKKDIPVESLYVVDCPQEAVQEVRNCFSCPIQLSILNDELTFHLV
jgi:hypothetical protein